MSPRANEHGPPQVLLVDDTDTIRRVLKQLLHKVGFACVLEARDGLEALELFGEHRRTICLVLMDLNMPRLDGWSTAWRLRQMELDAVEGSGARPLPIIACTSTDLDECMPSTHPLSCSPDLAVHVLPGNDCTACGKDMSSTGSACSTGVVPVGASSYSSCSADLGQLVGSGGVHGAAASLLSADAELATHPHAPHSSPHSCAAGGARGAGAAAAPVAIAASAVPAHMCLSAPVMPVMRSSWGPPNTNTTTREPPTGTSPPGTTPSPPAGTSPPAAGGGGGCGGCGGVRGRDVPVAPGRQPATVRSVALAAGCSHVVSKPLSMQQLCSLLDVTLPSWRGLLPTHHHLSHSSPCLTSLTHAPRPDELWPPLQRAPSGPASLPRLGVLPQHATQHAPQHAQHFAHADASRPRDFATTQPLDFLLEG